MRILQQIRFLWTSLQNIFLEQYVTPMGKSFIEVLLNSDLSWIYLMCPIWSRFEIDQMRKRPIYKKVPRSPFYFNSSNYELHFCILFRACKLLIHLIGNHPLGSVLFLSVPNRQPFNRCLLVASNRHLKPSLASLIV